jgi:AraC-like DNA-binding protein
MNRGLSTGQVAVEVGYESEAAFNRAFKSHVGIPPDAWWKSRLNRKSSGTGVISSL